MSSSEGDCGGAIGFPLAATKGWRRVNCRDCSRVSSADLNARLSKGRAVRFECSSQQWPVFDRD